VDVVEHVEHERRRAAVQRTGERPRGAYEGGRHVGAAGGDHARRERGGVHAVLRRQDQVAFGDPRAATLLDLLRREFPRAPRLRRVETLLGATGARGFPPPNVDLAVAAVTHVLDLPRGTGELIFALARIAGWVAHALEEYEHGSPLRLRAV
jgi:citrate synthase